MKHKKHLPPVVLALLFIISACNLPSVSSVDTATMPPPLPQETATTAIETTSEEEINPTNTPNIVHMMTPALFPSKGIPIYDVSSQDTAPEKRAPYGDSYKINRFERPFQQDMTYVPDLDIVTYSLSEDADWYYVSIELIGKDPNNELGINYGVEIDNDADGFGDTVIWAHPPYTPEWTNANVQVFEDKNHDTGGLSAEQADAPFSADGYESLLFDRGLGDDPDLAWVRFSNSDAATVQFAFKKRLTDGKFMLGVLADANLRDVGMLDYNDRFTAEEAGSPVRSNKYYPLGALYLLDNSCREAFGFKASGFEPQLCPRPATPTPEPSIAACTNPSQYGDRTSCLAAGCAWVLSDSTVLAAYFYCTYP
jgi:hypothetical protein